jgi:hypothetical protein
MSSIEAGRLLADLAHVKQLVAQHDKVQATRHEVRAIGQQVVVVVLGAAPEARVWHEALGGVIRPPWMARGVRHQLVHSDRALVEVVDHTPARGGHRG